MCEEACPVDAIELTSLYDLSGKSREEMIFDKEKLLSVYDQTKDAEPMRSRRGQGSGVRDQGLGNDTAAGAAVTAATRSTPSTPLALPRNSTPDP